MIDPSFTFIRNVRINDHIDGGPEHLRPLFAAVRDAFCALLIVMQGSRRFPIPRSLPSIAVILDDVQQAYGPKAFHRNSLKHLFRSAVMVVIVGGKPLPGVYREVAAFSAEVRANSVIVETRPEYETEWWDFILDANPGISMQIATVL